MLVFSTQLWEQLSLYPLTFSLVHLPPPPFPVSKYSTYKQCVAGRGRCSVVLETIFCRSSTLRIWPDSEPTKLLHRPKQEGCGAQTEKHLLLSSFVPLKVNFFWWRHFALLSISLIFLGIAALAQCAYLNHIVSCYLEIKYLQFLVPLAVQPLPMRLKWRHDITGIIIISVNIGRCL